AEESSRTQGARRPAPDQPRQAAGASAPHRDGSRSAEHRLPVLRGNAASHRRGRVGAPRRRTGPVPGDGGASSEVRLPGLQRRGRTKTGQLFAYARDDRPWAGSDPPGVAYVYAPDRKAERPIAHLKGFKGILQVDGYGGYKVLARQGDVRLAFCWSHARRHFYE